MARVLVDELGTRYDEPVRRYHTRHHVAAVLAALDDLAPELPDRSKALVEVAVWFHDAVYDPRADDNEVRSADLADERLTDLGMVPGDRDEVVRLVRLTAGHRPPTVPDPRATALLDADLAILGAEPEAYDAYRRAIRREYGHLSDDQFALGRRRVVEGLLDSPALFSGLRARRLLEGPARANLTAELRLLPDS